jgi:DNA polymerase-3 subunit delta
MKKTFKRSTYTASTSKPVSVPYTFYLQQIRSGKIEPVYILFGADHPGKQEFINELKTTDDYKFETFILTENESSRNERLNAFLSKAFTPSLWGEKMLLVLMNFQNLPAKQQKEVLDRMATIPNNYFAKVIIDSQFDKSLPELFQNYKFSLMNFYQPDERILGQYVSDMAKELGLVIDSEATKSLFDMIGTDFALIKQELEKIKTYLGDKTRITQDVILNTCGFSKESSIEELIKMTFNRNRTMSLSNLYQLQKDRIYPSIVVISLANTGMALLQVKLGANMKMVNMGVKRFAVLERQSNFWKQEELEKFILALARIDKKIKTGYPEPYVLLEVLLMKSGRN